MSLTVKQIRDWLVSVNPRAACLGEGITRRHSYTRAWLSAHMDCTVRERVRFACVVAAPQTQTQQTPLGQMIRASGRVLTKSPKRFAGSDRLIPQPGGIQTRQLATP